jgi:hypothetical protein
MIDEHLVQTADMLLKSTLRLAYRLRDDLDRVDTYQNVGLAVSDSTSYQPELLISVMSHSCPRLEIILCRRRGSNMNLPLPGSSLTLEVVTDCNTESQFGYWNPAANMISAASWTRSRQLLQLVQIHTPSGSRFSTARDYRDE